MVGTAYLIGGSSIALWTVPSPMLKLPAFLPGTLIFVACGMVWNGVRLFHGRRVLPIAIFAGALAWLTLCQIPAVAVDANLRIAIGAVIIAAYTFSTAIELWRERRKSLCSRTAAVVVPMLHAVIFLSPVAMHTWLPPHAAQNWIDVFVLEALVYAIGAAFIVLLMVKDHHVHIQRHAASTDPLTGLLNRRAFLEGARSLCALRRKEGNPVTLLMFDLDHFKSVNDTFGHAVGDDVLRLFASTVKSCMRADDIVGRLGGEEFAAIVPADLAATSRIAERIRASFEVTGAVVNGHPIGGTVSIGAAFSPKADSEVETFLARADAALYRAKHDGRNRLRTADDDEQPAQDDEAHGLLQRPAPATLCDSSPSHAEGGPGSKSQRMRPWGRLQRLVYCPSVKISGCCAIRPSLTRFPMPSPLRRAPRVPASRLRVRFRRPPSSMRP